MGRCAETLAARDKILGIPTRYDMHDSKSVLTFIVLDIVLMPGYFITLNVQSKERFRAGIAAELRIEITS